MPEIAFCTTLYEAGRPFWSEFREGLLAAASGWDAVMAVAVDGFADAGTALAGLPPARTACPPPGATAAQAREAMLAVAQASGASVCVFLDMDDVALPACVALHRAALAAADISYGDMELIDQAGAPLGARFFDGADVPRRVESPDAIQWRNFLGLTNTAARTRALARRGGPIPAGLVATDWYLWTRLIENGCVAARAGGAVVRYRLHGANALGARPDPAPAEVLRRIAIVRAHLAALPTRPERSRAIRALEQLAVRLPPSDRLAQACDRAAVWFDDVRQLALEDGTCAPS